MRFHFGRFWQRKSSVLEISPTIAGSRTPNYLANFNSSNAFADDIFISACNTFLCMYSASLKSLNKYRYNSFRLATSKHAANLQSLCPTEEAARQHAYRVYLQVQTWMGAELCMTNWGWKKEDARTFSPIMSSSPPATEILLKKIFCGCEKGCISCCGCQKLGTYCIHFRNQYEYRSFLIIVASYL